VCEGEKAEYERAYSEYNANPTKETHDALSAAYLRYVNCVSSEEVVEVTETATETAEEDEIPAECRDEFEAYQRAFIEAQSTYDIEERTKKEEELLATQTNYYNCVYGYHGETKGTAVTTPEEVEETTEKTPGRIKEAIRIHENLVVISQPTDEVVDQKFLEIMEELEKELEDYSQSNSDPEVMDRIIEAVDGLMDREMQIKEITANRDVETQHLIEEIVNSTPESEKSLVEEILYLALEKTKEKAVESTETYLKDELRKRGYETLVSKVEKFEEWNSKVNDYLSKAVELKEFKDEIDDISKLHKDGEITKEDSRILKAAIALKKCVSWLTSKIPIIGDSMSEVYTKSLDAGIKTGVMFAKHKKGVNEVIECLETNTC
jgi:hypothetical protein